MYNTWSSNNPFANDANNPHTRFPDISSLASPASLQDPNQEYRGYLPPQTSPTFGNQPGYFGQGILQQPTGAPFQPSSAFGQQLAANISGSSYGYLNGQSTGAGQNGYNPAQEQLRNNSNYIAQFDPYASLGQGWNASPQSSPQSLTSPPVWSPTSGSPATSTSQTGDPHPREYLRTHKSGLEAWDRSTWDQLLNVFDSLKNAWEGRAKELEERIGQLQMQYIGAYHPTQIQQESARLQGVGFC